MEPENNQNAPVENKTAKPKNNTAIIVIIVVVLIGISAVGYFAQNYFAKKTGEKIAEGILSAGTGSDVDVDTDTGTTKVTSGDSSFEISNTNEWPETMPSVVPKYSDGSITTSSSSVDQSSGSSWSVNIESTSLSEFQSYLNKLTGGGWTVGTTSNYNGDIYNQYSSGSYDIIITYTADSQTAALVVTEKTEASE